MKRAPRMDYQKVFTNGLGLAGAYGVTLADFTGAIPLPAWVGILSALAGVGLTAALILIRLGEARIKMAEARRLEIENEKLENGNENTRKPDPENPAD